VMLGAVNLTGVARRETPAVIPNQMKQTQAGFLSTRDNSFQYSAIKRKYLWKPGAQTI
jgi:hypothetical protein